MFYHGKKVLVTGGAGFVGSHLVEELLRQGAQVRVSVHHRPFVSRDERIEVMPADLTRPEDCRAAAHGMQFVFHAAGAVGAAGVGASGVMSGITTNLTLTAQMLEAAWAEGVERFLLFGSSTGYPAADHPVKEEEMWAGPVHSAYLGYGWMRRYAEKLGEFVASSSPMKIALVRPTAVYGQRDNFDPKTSHVIPALIRRAIAKENPFVVWGTGNEVRDFLHVSDLARGCVMLLEKHATCDPVNIGYGRTVTIKEIVQIILKAAGHEGAELKFDTTKPSMIPVRSVDTSKARRVLGFEPRLTLEEGLADTVRWYREQTP
ncbi:MAG: NAD-dependent epimerase/dehydratase family protein [Verrucomicrobia bacterium]|nr:NAD-dependent epimerase/dehydratase family protein [Verrucomicrobiota bacterium]